MATKKPAVKAKSTRRYKSQQNITHDLFKLLVAKVKKNTSWAPGQKEYVSVEHCHFYHSVDKSGAPQKTCSPIGGHFHEIIEETPATADAPATYRTSKAKKYMIFIEYGRQVKKIVDLEDDDHTHEVEYISSEDFKPQKLNAETAKLMSTVGVAPPSVPGISG